MKTGIMVATLIALMSVGGCSPDQRDSAHEDLTTEAGALEDAARGGAAARAGTAAILGAETLEEEVEQRGVIGSAEALAAGTERNVEDAAETFEESYDESREKGEDVVESGGEAYQSVLEAGKRSPEETSTPQR